MRLKSKQKLLETGLSLAMNAQVRQAPVGFFYLNVWGTVFSRVMNNHPDL